MQKSHSEWNAKGNRFGYYFLRSQRKLKRNFNLIMELSIVHVLYSVIIKSLINFAVYVQVCTHLTLWSHKHHHRNRLRLYCRSSWAMNKFILIRSYAFYFLKAIWDGNFIGCRLKVDKRCKEKREKELLLKIQSTVVVTESFNRCVNFSQCQGQDQW